MNGWMDGWMGLGHKWRNKRPVIKSPFPFPPFPIPLPPSSPEKILGRVWYGTFTTYSLRKYGCTYEVD